MLPIETFASKITHPEDLKSSDISLEAKRRALVETDKKVTGIHNKLKETGCTDDCRKTALKENANEDEIENLVNHIFMCPKYIIDIFWDAYRKHEEDLHCQFGSTAAANYKRRYGRKINTNQ